MPAMVWLWRTASERGSTVVVVLTVCVFAWWPLNRVMRVGLVERVSTNPLLRRLRICILSSWLGDVFELFEWNEADELEVVGVCIGVTV